MKTKPKRRNALPKMKPKKRIRSLYTHRHLVGLFAIAGAFLVILNLAVVLAPSREALATYAENVTGWAWSSNGGWLSMNNINAGDDGMDHGVHIEPGVAPRNMTGFAWSSNMGWVCFGATCAAHPECTGTTPQGGAAYAYIDGSGNARGWAKICALPNDDGWVSLNCTDSPAGCGASNYKVSVNFTTGSFSGWAYHGLAGALGWGWIDFSGVEMSSDAEDADISPPMCTDGIDNDYDGDIDCADSGCTFREPMCPSVETNCGLIGNSNCCANTIDDDYDGDIDCADADCAFAANCIPEDEHVVAGNACTDGVDNDIDGATDCADSDCVGAPGCEICDNEVDDDGDTDVDCDDSDCTTAPECTPAWLESKYGNVYATLGVEGNPPPPGQANATYCITSGGSITGFSSEFGCEEESEESITLPIGSDGYVSELGRIDVTGILNGRYGETATIASASQIDNILGGKIYIYEGGGTFTIPAKTFLNAAGPNSNGSGLLVIKGGDLNITGNLDYEAAGVTQYLRNLASFGILVLRDYDSGVGGNITIDSGVTKIVGTMYAERSISTGTTGSRLTDQQLQVYGALVSREVKLERLYSSPTESAEQVTFDGRAVVNPPPGYQDISKSLPALGDTF